MYLVVEGLLFSSSCFLMSSDWRQRSAQSDASTISPSTRLSPRLPSPVFQSSFTQASDQPIELFSTAQKSMYILTSDHASLHAKLMAKCTAHEEGFPPHPLTSSTCPKWVCSMAAIQFWFVPLCQANPSICQVQIFSSYSCRGREPPTCVNVS